MQQVNIKELQDLELLEGKADPMGMKIWPCWKKWYL